MYHVDSRFGTAVIEEHLTRASETNQTESDWVEEAPKSSETAEARQTVVGADLRSREQDPA